MFVGTCAAVLGYGPAGRQAACSKLGGDAALSAASATVPAMHMPAHPVAADSRANSGEDVLATHRAALERQQFPSIRIADSRPAMALAVIASLGSVWASMAVPLCRRMSALLGSASCPDACWQAAALPALVVGPLLFSLAFVTVTAAMGSFSAAAWRGLMCSAAVGAAGAVIGSVWSGGKAYVPSSAQGAPFIPR